MLGDVRPGPRAASRRRWRRNLHFRPRDLGSVVRPVGWLGRPPAPTRTYRAPRTNPVRRRRPFFNLSGNSEDAYFADGMTSHLITDLAKISGLVVIARNSSFAYKAHPPRAKDPRRISGALPPGGEHPASGRADQDQCPAYRFDDGRTCLGGPVRPRLRRYLRGPGRGHQKDRRGARGQADDNGAGRLARPPTTNLEAYDYYPSRRAGLEHRNIFYAAGRLLAVPESDSP